MDCPHILNLFYMLKINFKTLEDKMFCLMRTRPRDGLPVMLKKKEKKKRNSPGLHFVI